MKATVGVTREEALRLMASLSKQLEGFPCHEEFADMDGASFAIVLAKEDGEDVEESATDADVYAIQAEALMQHVRELGCLTAEELSATVKSVEQNHPAETPCTECGGICDDYMEDQCDNCLEARRLKIEHKQAEEAEEADRVNRQLHKEFYEKCVNFMDRMNDHKRAEEANPAGLDEFYEQFYEQFFDSMDCSPSVYAEG